MITGKHLGALRLGGMVMESVYPDSEDSTVRGLLTKLMQPSEEASRVSAGSLGSTGQSKPVFERL